MCRSVVRAGEGYVIGNGVGGLNVRRGGGVVGSRVGGVLRRGDACGSICDALQVMCMCMLMSEYQHHHYHWHNIEITFTMLNFTCTLIWQERME